MIGTLFCIRNQIKNDREEFFEKFFTNIVTIESNINCCWIDNPYSLDYRVGTKSGWGK